MRNAIWIVVVAAGLMATLALWSLGDADDPGAIEDETPTDLPPDMLPPAPIAVAPVPQAPAPADPPAEPAPAPAAVEEPPPAQLAIPHPSSREYGEMLEKTFMNDSPDEAEALEDELTGKVKAVLPQGSRLESLDCRRSTCRVRSSHRDMAAYEQYLKPFLESELSKRVWLGLVWVAVPTEPKSARDPVVSSIYLTRNY